MTNWKITLTADSREDDSKVMRVMQLAAKLGLKYSVVSKELPPQNVKEYNYKKDRELN